MWATVGGGYSCPWRNCVRVDALRVPGGEGVGWGCLKLPELDFVAYGCLGCIDCAAGGGGFHFLGGRCQPTHKAVKLASCPETPSSHGGQSWLCPECVQVVVGREGEEEGWRRQALQASGPSPNPA